MVLETDAGNLNLECVLNKINSMIEVLLNKEKLISRIIQTYE